MTFSLCDLIAILTPRQVDTDRFALLSPSRGTPRVFGGQMIGQTIMVAGHNAPADRQLHSLNATFVGPGDPQKPIIFTRQTLKGGSSFTQLQLWAHQDERLIFSATASLHVTETAEVIPVEGDLPELPGTGQDEVEFLAGTVDESELNTSIERDFFTALIERRSRNWIDPLAPCVEPAKAGFWCRFRGDAGQAPPLMHQALLGYLSDLDILHTAMRPRGIGTRHPGTASATLNHAMWFHTPLRADEWFYYDLAGRGISNNVALGLGGLHRMDGALAVTVAQEGLLRHGVPPRGVGHPSAVAFGS